MIAMIRVRRPIRKTLAGVVLAAMGSLSLPGRAACCPVGPEPGAIASQRNAPPTLAPLDAMPCCGQHSLVAQKVPPLKVSASERHLVVMAASRPSFAPNAAVTDTSQLGPARLVRSLPPLFVLHSQFLI